MASPRCRMQLIAARINWCSVTLGVGHRVADCGTGFFGIRGWAAIPDIRRLPHSALVTTRSRLQMTKCHGRVQVLVQLQPQRATIETTRLSNHNHNVPQSKPQGCPTTTTTCHNRNHKVVQPQPQRATRQYLAVQGGYAGRRGGWSSGGASRRPPRRHQWSPRRRAGSST